jgi:hypothetical protein
MRLNINGGRLDVDRRWGVVGTGCSSRAKDCTGREATEYTGRDLATISASVAGEQGNQSTNHRYGCQNDRDAFHDCHSYDWWR